LGEEDSEELTGKKVLEEAFKRLLPALAYQISPAAGLATSVVVFTSWLIMSLKGGYKEFSIREDDKAVAKLLKDIKEQEARVKLLEKAREKRIKEGGYIDTIDEVLNAEKTVLDNLRIELELRQLRLEALRRLRAKGDLRLMAEVKRMVEKIEKGKGFEEEELKILKELEERWRRKEIQIAALREVLKHVM